MQAPRSVLILQTWGIGDVIMTTPLLRAARNYWPHARISLAVRSIPAAELFHGSALADDVLLVPKQRSAAFAVWLVSLRGRFDLAIVATRQHRSWPFLLSAIGGIRAVVADSATERPRFVRAHRVVSTRDPEHRAESNLRLFEELVGPVPRYQPVVEIGAEETDLAERLLRELDLPAASVLLGVHTGSEPRVTQKRYPDVQMREALQLLIEREPRLHVLMFFGGEANDAREAYRGLHARLRLVEDQPLRVVAALTGHCRAFLAGDTGLAHIAASRGANVVVLAGPTQVESTRPIGPDVQVLRTTRELSCMPCYETPLYGTCNHVSCMTSIPAVRVADAVLRALSADRSGHSRGPLGFAELQPILISGRGERSRSPRA